MRIVLLLIGWLILTTLASASDFMKLGQESYGPEGFVELCQRRPEICQKQNHRAGIKRVQLTIGRLEELDKVNRYVNQRVTPMLDAQKHGVAERWEMLDCDASTPCYGDCEEYVLLKRRELLARGWPASALLITVVRDTEGNGHAVLTVRTTVGDYVLDNQANEVMLWHRTLNKFRMRQSAIDPTVWFTIKQPEATSGVATSSWSTTVKKRRR